MFLVYIEGDTMAYIYGVEQRVLTKSQEITTNKKSLKEHSNGEYECIKILQYERPQVRSPLMCMWIISEKELQIRKVSLKDIKYTQKLILKKNRMRYYSVIQYSARPLATA